MTESVVVYSDKESGAAGTDLAAQIGAAFGDRTPDAIILFASPVHDFPALLSALASEREPKAMIGCSSAGEFVSGASGSIIRSTATSAAEAATGAAEDALGQLGGATPSVALFFDCVATRLRLGDAFALELDALKHALGDGQFIGCNTHGQIARSNDSSAAFTTAPPSSA